MPAMQDIEYAVGENEGRVEASRILARAAGRSCFEAPIALFTRRVRDRA
jgi:hypothetical protein